jgi:mRNA-degrading endonuclease toxin of MazEF toxin-antitoxin module
MSSLAEQLKKSGVIQIGPREIWVVKDSLIIFPEDRKPGQKSTKHIRRFVLVLSNDWICSSLDSPCVVVAPLSHLISFKATSEIQIKKNQGNGLEHDSRAALGHLQPVLKTELQVRVGKLTDTQWEEITNKLTWNFDLEFGL